MTALLRTIGSCLLAVGLCGCAATVVRPTAIAPCIAEQSRELVIRWGTEDDSLKTFEGYQLNTKGEVFSLRKRSEGVYDTTFFNVITPSAYCTRSEGVRSAFLKTQALSVRGVRARFVEYVNPKSDVYLRVVWNPDIPTFQSRFFRAEFDSLQRFVAADR